MLAATALHEIEVKYRVLDPHALLTALAAHDIHLGPAMEQDDQAYAPKGWQYGDGKLGVPFVRLRTQAGRHIFTLKRPVDNELSCVEHETEVADRQAMHRAILAMDFRPTVRIRKARRTGSVGSLLICVDEIAGLGCFLEVETMRDEGSIGLAEQRTMHDFVQQLGAKVQRTTATYDSLIYAARSSA